MKRLQARSHPLRKPFPPARKDGAHRRGAILLAAFLASFPLALGPRAAGAAPGAALPVFLRGDANSDGAVDLSDPITLLGYLFGGGPAPPCADGADADDGGSLEITDAIRILDYLFQGGPALPAPHPEPGADPTGDPLGCESPHDFPERPSTGGLPPLESELERLAAAPDEDVHSIGLLQVSPEVFSALAALRPGDSPRALGGPPGLAETLAAIEGVLPAAGAPVAIGAPVLAPLPEGEACWTVDAALLDGGSFDTDLSAGRFLRGDLDRDGGVDEEDLGLMEGCFAAMWNPGDCGGACPDAWDVDDDGRIDRGDLEALIAYLLGDFSIPPPGPAAGCGPDPTADGLPPCPRSFCRGGREGLAFSAEPPVLCGPGTHQVILTVTDPEGRSGRAAVPVTLCAASEPGCPAAPEREPAPAGALDQRPIACRWIAARWVRPEGRSREIYQRTYTAGGRLKDERREPPFDPLSPMLIASRDEGPGSLHTLLATRKLANCYTPEETLERHAEGIIEVRVNLLCLDDSGAIAEPPCAARLEAEGIYRSAVAAATSSGAPCSGLLSRVESLAQDETRFAANDSVVFAKALTLQNGTQVTITPAYGLAMGQQVSRMGQSVSFQYRFGITQSVLLATGSESGLLNAFGNARPDLPATLTLESQGRTRIFGERRANARAEVHTRAAGLWLAGTAGCPGAGWFALQIIFGDPPELEDARKRAEQFFLTRLGRRTP